MTDIKKNNHSVRFFSDAAINENLQSKSVLVKEPKPFGLNFQEAFPDIENMPTQEGFTLSQTPTNTASGPDSCSDVDVGW